MTGEDTATGRTLRSVMATFATGITVLTAAHDDAHGMTANAFCSVSLDPPLVLCCVLRTSRVHEMILLSRRFTVNILSAGQEDLARYFANRNRPQGAAQFEDIECLPGRHSTAPRLAGSLAWMECELSEVYHGGDHSIFLGSVLDAEQGPGEALVFFGGKFHQAISTPPS